MSLLHPWLNESYITSYTSHSYYYINRRGTRILNVTQSVYSICNRIIHMLEFVHGKKFDLITSVEFANLEKGFGYMQALTQYGGDMIIYH